MKAIQKIKYGQSLLGLVMIGTTFFACSKKNLTVDPRQSISSERALTSRANVNAAVNSVYAGLQNTLLYGRDMFAVADALSDITRGTNRTGRLTAENNNNLRAHMAFWATSYGLINEVNLVLDAAPAVKDATTADRNSWEGQLKFLRGLLYFDLVKSYAYIPTAVIAANDMGGVPIKLTGTNSAGGASSYLPSRDPINKVYDQIMADLTVAIAKLDNSLGNGYATRAAAKALLSRVALYRGDWPTCVAQSTAALAEGFGTLSSAASCLADWRKAVHPESLFEVKFQTPGESAGQNLSLQTTYTTLLTPGGSCNLAGQGNLVPSAFLLTQLGITSGAVPTCGAVPVPGVITRGADVRAQLYEWGAVGRGTPTVECTKFLGKNGTVNLDNVPVIRVAEMYLNRAEAYAMQGGAANEALALADLNTMLTNRGLPTVTLSGAALINEILKQRMLELAFEGHRFFDLKRRGQDIIKSPANVPFNDIRILANIPQGDIDGNPNMKQNPGY